MITRYEHRGLLWVDAESPTEEETESLEKEFAIPSLVAEEMRAPSLRPKVDFYRDMLYLVLHFPAFRHSNGDSRNQEVDFIIGKRVLITVRYDDIDAIRNFAQEFEVNSILEKSHMGDHAGYLFYFLARKLYRSLLHELEHIENRLGDAEARIFRGDEENMVAVLSNVSRDLLNFKQVLRGHEDVLSSFERIGQKFFGDSFAPYIGAILGEYVRVGNALDGHKETLHELRSTNDSLLSAKTNAVMKTLTAITVGTFLPAIVAGLFSMKTVDTPLVGSAGDFWVLFAIMALLTAATFAFFSYKKWI